MKNRLGRESNRNDIDGNLLACSWIAFKDIKKQFFLFWNVKGEILALWFIFCYRNEKTNQTAANSSNATAVPATTNAAIKAIKRIIRQ